MRPVDPIDRLRTWPTEPSEWSRRAQRDSAAQRDREALAAEITTVAADLRRVGTTAHRAGPRAGDVERVLSRIAYGLDQLSEGLAAQYSDADLLLCLDRVTPRDRP